MDTKLFRVKRQHVAGLIWECQHKGWLVEVYEQEEEPTVTVSNPHWVNDGESLDDLLEGYYQSGKIYL